MALDSLIPQVTPTAQATPTATSDVATSPLSTYGAQTTQNYVTPPTLATAG